jgi:hypothetical protein
MDVANAINQAYSRRGMKPININVKAEYQKGGELERLSHAHTMKYLAPLIASVHLSDFFKLPAGLPARVLWDTFNSLNDQTINNLKDISGIFFHTQHSIYDNDFKFRTGRVARLTGIPDAAAIIHKTFHQPFFNNVRMAQISTFGTAAYHASQVWAKEAFHGDTYAAEQLKSLNLDVPSIMRRGGNLNEEELAQAIWHFTNDRLFIDKPLERSELAQKNPYFRVAFMLHGYATREGRFIKGELYKMMKHNQYGKIAQFLGVLGIAFPVVAPLIKSLNTLVRDGDPDEAKQQLQDTYGNLLHPDGFGDFAGTYLDLIGHFSGIGAFTTYLHAAANHRLAQQSLGAGPNVALGTLEDIASGAKGGKKGTHNWSPATRDILKYFTIPIFGGILAHHLVGKKAPSLTRR